MPAKRRTTRKPTAKKATAKKATAKRRTTRKPSVKPTPIETQAEVPPPEEIVPTLTGWPAGSARG